MSEKVKVIEDHNFADAVGYNKNTKNLYEELNVENSSVKDSYNTIYDNEEPRLPLYTSGYVQVLDNSKITQESVWHETPFNGSINLDKISFTFNEDKYINELLEYVKSTYTQHYAQGKYQATEVIFDKGHGLGFCWGNAEKYLSRYGKKEGYNRKDLLKTLHYVIMLLYIHDIEKLGN